jgi:hypothetical protein
LSRTTSRRTNTSARPSDGKPRARTVSSPKFLEGFEDFFDDYYDTEIFSARVWDRLDKDPANLQKFCEKLNFILGINTWDQTFSTRGIVHYNYRRIDEDIFGKSYEMFLAANRKDEGIYYTPADITGPMR